MQNLKKGNTNFIEQQSSTKTSSEKEIIVISDSELDDGIHELHYIANV